MSRRPTRGRRSGSATSALSASAKAPTISSRGYCERTTRSRSR
jgi:hypothetical protein